MEKAIVVGHREWLVAEARKNRHVNALWPCSDISIGRVRALPRGGGGTNYFHRILFFFGGHIHGCFFFRGGCRVAAGR